MMERYPQQIQQLVGSLDIENLKKVGTQLESLLNKQIKSSIKPTPLPILRIVIQKMVTLANRETVKESFPELVFTLNKLIQDPSLPAATHKLARLITAAGFVGSQRQFKRLGKAERKDKAKDKAKEKEENGDGPSEESDQEGEEPDKEVKQTKGGLYYTKSKAYQKSRKRKSVSAAYGLDEGKQNNRHHREKKDTKWFANGSGGSDGKRRKV